MEIVERRLRGGFLCVHHQIVPTLEKNDSYFLARIIRCQIHNCPHPGPLDFLACPELSRSWVISPELIEPVTLLASYLVWCCLSSLEIHVKVCPDRGCLWERLAFVQYVTHIDHGVMVWLGGSALSRSLCSYGEIINYEIGHEKLNTNPASSQQINQAFLYTMLWLSWEWYALKVIYFLELPQIKARTKWVLAAEWFHLKFESCLELTSPLVYLL